MTFSCLDLCSGAGGQALGLENAGFEIVGVVERDTDPARTLSTNRPGWQVQQIDIRSKGWCTRYRGVDLLSAGAPCTPFSSAGRQAGRHDSRDVLLDVLDVIDFVAPRWVLMENVPALLSDRFAPYLSNLLERLRRGGYATALHLLRGTDVGVPQKRIRLVVLGCRGSSVLGLARPAVRESRLLTVGQAVSDLMAADGWPGADAWARLANSPAPTIVGGSRLHGGPDLGPSRTKAAWARLAVDGRSVADRPPTPSDPRNHIPRLTLRMLARLQDFPDEWKFSGSKTSVFRQIGNAFPPSMAEAAGRVLLASI
ncbi:MAG: (cytosine-5)-methyltransferase 1 [Frankiaceae bacterium]|nr:(cytosine-5)-methyltransferase 1 [Frankiaceae bacterium]